MSNATPIQKELVAEFERDMLTVIKSGEATAADRNVLRQYFKDLGLSRMVDADDPLRKLADDIRKGGGELSAVQLEPLNDEDDEATDGREAVAING